LAVDAFVMLDQSGSMTELVAGGQTKWAVTVAAINAVAQQSYPSTVNLALDYFAQPKVDACPTTCLVDADCGALCGPCFFGLCLGVSAGTDSCDPADYRTPEVTLAPLPGNAAAVSASLASHQPSTGTPTSAALQGAIQAAAEHGLTMAGADNVTAVFLVSDGEPSGCDESYANIQALARAGLDTPPHVLTFVVGIGAGVAAALDGVASAGGTDHAYVVDTTAAGAQEQVRAAMQDAVDHSRCTLRMPDPAGAMPTWRLRITTASTVDDPPAVSGRSQCVDGTVGWYQDATGSTAVLCPQTCTAAAQGTLAFVTGCN